MGFFKVLGEIGKNNKNFKRWEQEQRDKDAQRQVLHEKYQHTPEELEKARRQGEKIIDIIDVMDNHSESVAENVETAVQPIVGVAPMLVGIGATLASAKLVINPAYKQINAVADELLASDAYKNLYKEIRDYNYKNNYKNYFRTSNLTSNFMGIGDAKRRNIKDPELKKKVQQFYRDYAEKTKIYKTKTKWGLAAIPAAFIATFVGATLYATKLQVDSSKIARFQARESLKDPKAFVDYTPEQIEQAKAEIEANPELRKQKKNEKLKQGFFKSIYGLFRDRKAYKAAKKNDSDESKIITRPLTEEEVVQAQKDKEVIQRTVKLINNEAEKYSENMEVAAGVLIGGTPFLGAAVGGATSWILNKTGVIDRWLDKTFKNNASEETKKLYEEMQELNKQIRTSKSKRTLKQKAEYSLKFGEFFSSATSEARNEIADDVAQAGKKKSTDFLSKLKINIKSAMVHHKGRNWLIAGVGAMITGFAGMIIGLKLQKASARAGRYTAKRELEKDPRNFIGYTEEDYESVKDVKNDKKPTSKVKEVICFIPNVLKQYRAYNKYKKTEFKENKLLQEQLQKQEVSEQQLVDATNLQRKLFNTFEKVDDNSQIYSESMEAATEIAQPFIMYGGIALALTPIIVALAKVAKAKQTPGQLVDKISGWLSKSSWIMKSKLAKSYLNNVAENIPVQTIQHSVEYRPLAALLKDVNLIDDPIIDIFSKTWNNLRKTPENISKLSDSEINEFLSRMRWDLKRQFKLADDHKFLKFIDDISYRLPKEQKIDVLDILLNPQKIKDMPPERYKKATEVIKEKFVSLGDNVIETYLLKNINNQHDLEGFVKLLTDVKLLDDSVVDAFSKKWNNYSNISNGIENMTERDLRIFLHDFKSEIQNKCKLPEDHRLFEFIDDVCWQTSKEEKIDILDMLFSPDKIREMSYERYHKVMERVNKYKLTHMVTVGKLAENIPFEKIKEYLSVLVKDAPELGLKPSQLDDIAKLLDDIQTRPNRLIEAIFDSASKQENVIKNLELLRQISAKINESGAKIKSHPEIQKLLQTKISLPKGYYDLLEQTQEFVVKPRDITTFKLPQRMMEGEDAVVTKSIDEIVGTLTSTLKTVRNYRFKDYFALIPEAVKNPKEMLGSLKSKIEKMSAEEFEAFVGNFGSMIDKKTLLGILPKIEKIMDNIPKKELENIMTSMIKSFNENPDEFVKMIKTGIENGDLINKIFVTPETKKVMAALGVSWATLTLVLTYAFQSWLADMQLKAGRLGVMKSLEELDDPRYYANTIRDEKV